MPEPAQRSSAATRQRILQAAMIRFARHPYEDARLRDIAADAEIDVAMVHRAFGSKEQLFVEVVRAAFQARTSIEEQTDPPEQAFARATSKERREAINSSIVRKEDGTWERSSVHKMGGTAFKYMRRRDGIKGILRVGHPYG